MKKIESISMNIVFKVHLFKQKEKKEISYTILQEIYTYNAYGCDNTWLQRKISIEVHTINNPSSFRKKWIANKHIKDHISDFSKAARK